MSAIEPGDRAEVQAAHRELLRALEWQPGFVRALMLAARTAMLLGQYEESWRHVGKVERAGPGYPPALLQKAWLHTIGDPGNPYHDPDAARGLRPARRAAARDDPSLARGVNCYRGSVTHRGVAEAQSLRYTEAPWHRAS